MFKPFGDRYETIYLLLTIVVTEYCDGGSLYKYLHSNEEITEEQQLSYIMDIAEGMVHLHYGMKGKEVIHRDLAARNILLKNDIALITDLGKTSH
jgi:serine/threonine protein kinase